MNYWSKIICLVSCLTITFLIGCKQEAPSLEEKIIAKADRMPEAVMVQLVELLRQSSDTSIQSNRTVKNPISLSSLFASYKKPIFTSRKNFTQAATVFQNFLNKESKFYGLYPQHYNIDSINALTNLLTTDSIAMQNAEMWARAELLMSDAFMQICKHTKYGRLYTDTNYKYADSNLTNNILLPMLTKFASNPDSLPHYLASLEPKFADYDSLKLFLKNNINNIENEKSSYTKLMFPAKDSATFSKLLIKRLSEEGINAMSPVKDSAGLSSLIRQYQTAHKQTESGVLNKEFVEGLNNMNINGAEKFRHIALAMDKYRSFKTQNNGNYVLVNIPSYLLRAYAPAGAVLESKVAVGKIASQTPVMESQISDIIVMPRWYVPPSILKIPGYIDRKRKNPNYIVRGKSVIQKSGPGNALGKMKFNFKSGDAIYLHDTNEKWAFGSSKRAVSHGCVRVQEFVKLASYLNSVTPLVEKVYTRVKDKMEIDSIKGDTTWKYRSVVKDSVVHNGDVVPNMVARNAHHELEMQQKVPVYIKYITCAIRNGAYVQYPDVYGLDKGLLNKYF